MTTQQWDPEQYAKNARFVADLGMAVVDLLDPQPGERILDVGCGDGALTMKLAAMGCDVVGIDGSAEQIAAAKKLGLDAWVMDGQAMTFDTEFDAVFSNAALHWMKRDPDAVIDGAWRALKPGGRFVAEFGGKNCVQTIKDALSEALRKRGIDPEQHNPWFFPGPAEYGPRLEARGFEIASIQHVERPTPLPGDIVAWLQTLANPFLNAVSNEERPALLEEVREAMRPKLCDAEGRWTADYTRLRFAATKPA